ncbi:MAG: hypothetical protein FWG45_07240 [Oscillospiraceae bacterium]|nr:hypothetical protein [Oscillospiraceae bacterium]
MKKFSKLYVFFAIAIVSLTMNGCFDTNKFGKGWNNVIIGLGIAAAVILLAFIAYAIVTTFYKGKVVMVKVLKKKETRVLRGSTIGRGTPGYKGQTDLSRRARRQKTRMRYSKVVVELDGEKKTLRCNDVVLLDKLVVGKINKIRIRFGEIVKIQK